MYCYASEDVVAKRLKEHDEECPYNYGKAQKLLRDNIKRFYSQDKVIKVDTSNMTPTECIELIIEKLKEINRDEL